MITVLQELRVSCRKTYIKKKKILNRSNSFFHTRDTNEVIFPLKLKITIDPSPSILSLLWVLPSVSSSKAI